MMQVGQKHGMQTMNQGLFQAYASGTIRLDDALGRSPNIGELESLIAKADPTYQPHAAAPDPATRTRRAA
jgi:Tfp pilus assembly ATPase PilU